MNRLNSTVTIARNALRPILAGGTDVGGDTLGRGMGEGLERAAAVLDDAGYEVVPIPPPVDITDVMRGWDPHFGRWVALDIERWAAEIAHQRAR